MNLYKGYKDRKRVLKWWAKKNENIHHTFKNIQNKRVLIFNAQAFKSITKGKTILHIVCRARGQRNCDFHSETVELSSSCDKCAHPHLIWSCLHTSQWLNGAPVLEQYGDRKSSFRNLTWEQGGARRGEIIVGSGTSFPAAILHGDNLSSTEQRWIQDYLLY